MPKSDLDNLLIHLTEAVVILKRIIEASPEETVKFHRNPIFFRETGHLSDAGIANIYKLFDSGKSIEQVATEMNISIRGAAGRRQAWIKSRK